VTAASGRIVQPFPSVEALTGAAAEAVASAARAAVAARGRFTLVLAGGDTPRPVYELLASAYRDAVPWPQVTVFFGDERCVPPDDARSNYRLAHDALLSRVPVGDVHRMEGELPALEAAARYDATLHEAVGRGHDGATFDLVLLSTRRAPRWCCAPAAPSATWCARCSTTRPRRIATPRPGSGRAAACGGWWTRQRSAEGGCGLRAVTRRSHAEHAEGAEHCLTRLSS
jgi:6-phosphogluconolactonase